MPFSSGDSLQSVRALAVLLVLLLPCVAADTAHDGTVGLNLGVVAPGLWNAWAFETGAGGSFSISLTWAETGVFPFADYDLRLYEPGALDDQQFEQSEQVAESSAHPYAHHSEAMNVALAPGRYWIAVVPFQAQGEQYTLTTSGGTLAEEELLFGYVAYKP